MRRVIFELNVALGLAHQRSIEFVLDLSELFLQLGLVFAESDDFTLVEILFLDVLLDGIDEFLDLGLFLFDCCPRTLSVLHLAFEVFELPELEVDL